MKKFKVTYDIEQTIKQGRFEVTFECTSADAARALIESPIGPPAGATRLCRPVSDILGGDGTRAVVKKVEEVS